MNRKLHMAAPIAVALGLAACNETAPDQKTTPSSAVPTAMPAQARQEAPASPIAAQAKLAADMQLSDKVKLALDPSARGHIEVAAVDGVVTLYGTVDAPSDKDRVALAAMGVEGVRSVVNNLVVLTGS